ncbi:pentapeptide repeat-containing protein [Gandjariella thermophila]|uniref:Pentapeptide repeat protein n=1 Tax=Gandjariella thermophila TaxID=1931992 RepID=A0A4D4J1L2_9PSEU|nr:pentapeptide repeat-containing protein [Gandjariella thermophila]GDY28972.1 hypothetical protein GTS_06050 [Gandjariella thermophila]
MLSTTTIAVWAVGLIIVAGLSVAVLWTQFSNGDQRDSVRLDTIRTAASIVVGTGGAAALLLTARRQRSTELDLKQNEHDATERRVTELYGKAADQLGSDKAPLRLAGLYALERLAQGNPAHRQTIVNLICAYLRMPFVPPPTPSPADLSSTDGRTGRRRLSAVRPRVRPADGPAELQELEVRQTAQRLLVEHLRPGKDDRQPDPSYWEGMDLNLTGATLVKLVMTHARVRSATFHGATFHGPTTFRGTVFMRNADFRATRFVGLADFRRVTFDEESATFKGAVFEGEVDFGTHTAAPLAGATTRTTGETRRKWPAEWAARDISGRPGWARLVARDQAAESR